MQDIIKNEFITHKDTIETTYQALEQSIQEVANILIECIKNGNKILICGNGGSAADAQHISAELTGRYKIERRALPAIALTTDTSALTAIGNDYGYDRVFDRQVEALANSGDVLLGISTSGNSQNIINAFSVANDKGCITIGLSGKDGGKMNDYCKINMVVPSNNTPRIQEMHILIGHTLCQCIDQAYTDGLIK